MGYVSEKHSRDPDDLWGDEKVCMIEIAIRRNGAMSVAGHIEDKKTAIAMLTTAIDTIKNYHARKAAQLIVPRNESALVDVGN